MDVEDLFNEGTAPSSMAMVLAIGRISTGSGMIWTGIL